jgi:hypothetical protein
MASNPRNPKIEGKAAQLSDFSPAGRKVAEQLAFTDLGSMATRAPQVLASDDAAKLAGKVGMKPMDRQAVETALPYLKDKKVTVNSAANNRVSFFEKAAQTESPITTQIQKYLPTTLEDGSIDSGVRSVPESGLAGAGWYFKHHKDIADAAKTHGFDTNRAITASAIMSPQNSPNNEKEAVSALMQAHHGTVTIPQHLAPVINAKMSPESQLHPSQVGLPVSVRDLHPDIIAHLSTANIRDQIGTDNVDLKAIAKGKTKINISKAISVLRGHISEEDAINPHNAPKIHSYRNAIRDAVPNSPEHSEYMLRAAHLADVASGNQLVGQQMIDYHGLRDSREGMLSPTRNTAEDTWMNSISHGQTNETVPGTPTNVMKTAGTLLGYTGSKTRNGALVDPDSRLDKKAIQHAVNNAATVKASEKLEKKYNTGFAVPSVMVQEVPWTQARREGNKDPEFNKAQTAIAKTQAPAQTPKTSRKGSFVQGTFPGM